MPKMPKNVSADKSMRREAKRKRDRSGMVVTGRSALLKRVPQGHNKRRCSLCGGPKNKKARVCKQCETNPPVLLTKVEKSSNL